MSLSEQRRRLQPFLRIVEDISGLGDRQCRSQESMTALIVQEVLGSEAIRSLTSVSELRLALYETVLWLVQPYKSSIIAPQEEEAFVDQLETLLFKKEEQISELKDEISAIAGEMEIMSQDLEHSKIENAAVEKLKSTLELRCSELQEQLQAKIEEEAEKQELLIRGWAGMMKDSGIDKVDQEVDHNSNDMWRVLLSQAATIEQLLPS